LTLTQLADHIEQRHHGYVKTELPRLEEMAARVARRPGGRDPRMAEVHATVCLLRDERFSHRQKEEKILYHQRIR
jgi:regulator of cell morphogenesis and NO signaling